MIGASLVSISERLLHSTLYLLHVGIFCVYPVSQLCHCVSGVELAPTGLHRYPSHKSKSDVLFSGFPLSPSVEKIHTVSIHPPCERKIKRDCFLS